MQFANSSHEYFYFVKPGDTLSAIVKDVFGPFRTHQAWMAKVRDVATRSHIKDPNRIYPGQVIALGPNNWDVCHRPIPLEELLGLERT